VTQLFVFSDFRGHSAQSAEMPMAMKPNHYLTWSKSTCHLANIICICRPAYGISQNNFWIHLPITLDTNMPDLPCDNEDSSPHRKYLNLDSDITLPSFPANHELDIRINAMLDEIPTDAVPHDSSEKLAENAIVDLMRISIDPEDENALPDRVRDFVEAVYNRARHTSNLKIAMAKWILDACSNQVGRMEDIRTNTYMEFGDNDHDKPGILLPSLSGGNTVYDLPIDGYIKTLLRSGIDSATWNIRTLGLALLLDQEFHHELATMLLRNPVLIVNGKLIP